MNKRLLCLSASAIVAIVLTLTPLSYAEQTSDTGSATQTGNPDAFVEILVNDDTISYGTLNISGQTNTRNDGSSDYVIFESENDLTNDSIAFDEGATNSNLFAKITYTGETFPVSNGLDNTDWLFLRDSSGTGYIQSQISGTLTNGGGGVTMPGGVTEIGSFSDTLVYYTTADAGTTWTRDTKTIYVALGDNGRLYVDDSADLASAEYVTAKGEATDDAFFANNVVITSTFPTSADDTVTLDFGYYIAWDATQGNADKAVYSLIDIPKHAATGHNWTWNLTIANEYQSDPS